MGGMSTEAMEVHLINTETMTILGTVNVGANSPHGIALSDDGGTLWVSSNQASHFFKIDTDRFGDSNYQPESFKIASDVPDNSEINDGIYEPLEVELSIDGSQIIISCSDSDKNQVRVYDTVSGDSVAVYSMMDGMGMNPWHIAVVPDGTGLYTTNRSMMSPRVSYINFSDGNVTQIESSEFDTPHGIGITSDGSKVFVSSSAMMTGGNSYLHIINTAANEVESSIILGEGVSATGLAVMQTTCENCD